MLAITERRERRAGREQSLMLRDALLVHRQLGDRWRVASVLEEIAGSLLARRDPRLASEILAGADALRARLGTPIPPAEIPDRNTAATRLRRRLNDAAFQAATVEGRTRDIDRTIDLAVEAIDSEAAAISGPGNGDTGPILTVRELAVLELLTQGRTNREIAASLYISPSTAGVHVSNILRKLGAKRRVDAAGLAHTMGLLPAN
jgi:DNA-binding CsgD family transcriptional regulator